MSHRLLFAVSSILATVAVVGAVVSWCVPAVPALQAGDHDWMCFGTPIPIAPNLCGCPIPGFPHDFCATTKPRDGDTIIPYFYCQFAPEWDCNRIAQWCGGRVWNCAYATCTTPMPDPPPDLRWGCILTSKPDFCNHSYETCDNP